MADNFFPARDEPYVGKDNVPRTLGKEQYINRLVALADQKAREGDGKC
jgi:hypothetical protein